MLSLLPTTPKAFKHRSLIIIDVGESLRLTPTDDLLWGRDQFLGVGVASQPVVLLHVTL